MSKLYFILLLSFGVGCVSLQPPPKEVLSSQVKVIFTNESPYPIGNIVFASSHTEINPAYNKYIELDTLVCPIMPKESDSLLLNYFNFKHYSLQVFFLVDNDTVRHMLAVNGTSSNQFIRGTLHYLLYYADEYNLRYFLEMKDTSSVVN